MPPVHSKEDSSTGLTDWFYGLGLVRSSFWFGDKVASSGAQVLGWTRVRRVELTRGKSLVGARHVAPPSEQRVSCARLHTFFPFLTLVCHSNIQCLLHSKLKKNPNSHYVFNFKLISLLFFLFYFFFISSFCTKLNQLDFFSKLVGFF